MQYGVVAKGSLVMLQQGHWHLHCRLQQRFSQQMDICRPSLILSCSKRRWGNLWMWCNEHGKLLIQDQWHQHTELCGEWVIGKEYYCDNSIMGNLLSRDIVERTDLVLSAAEKVNPQNAIKISGLARRMLSKEQRRINRAAVGKVWSKMNNLQKLNFTER